MNQASTFHNTLDLIRYGELSDELDDKFAQLVQKVEDTGKAGEITLKIKVKKGSANQLEITDNVSIKLPQPTRASTLVFALPDGAVTRTDPRQASIDFAIKAPLTTTKPAITIADEPAKPAVKV